MAFPYTSSTVSATNNTSKRFCILFLVLMSITTTTTFAAIQNEKRLSMSLPRMRRSLELDNSVDEISPNNSYDKRGDISTFETWEEPLRTVEDALDNPENPYLYYYANGPLVYRRKKSEAQKLHRPYYKRAQEWYTRMG